MKFKTNQSEFLKFLEDTWPPEQVIHFNDWIIRISDGAGKRASAISLEGTWEETSFRKLKDLLKKLGKSEIFMIYQSDSLFEKELDKLNYQVFDKSYIFEIPVTELIKSKPPPISMFSIWPPLHIQKELWNSNGIGWQRQSVMNRASQIKTSILGRWSDNPVASAFIAKSGNVAFLHALVVDENFRQQGVAKALMRHAGQWAHKHNCSKLMVVTTEANVAATSLYTSLEFQLVNKYHYRIPEA
jgi:GNAT superfamily N-acetyltransferase|tara:strand:- start:1762 stop:2490 length:729 start_codon:yes stop_codon:yes gene_type:complete